MSTYNEYLDFLQHTDNNSRQEVEKKINGLQDDIKALKSSLNTLQKDRDRISDDLAKTKKAMNDKEDELNMKSVEIESMLKKQKEKDNENKKLLEEQARKSEKKISELKSQNEQRLSELKSQNEQRFSELQKQSNKDKGLLEQLREEKAALQKERDKLSSKLAQQNSTNESDKQALNKQLESEKQTVKRLEEKIRSLNEEHEQLLEQLKAGAEEKSDENAEEVKHWKEAYENLSLKFEACQAQGTNKEELLQVKQKCEQLTTQLTTANDEKEKAYKEINEFKQALSGKDKKANELELKLEKVKQGMSAMAAIGFVCGLLLIVIYNLMAPKPKTEQLASPIEETPEVVKQDFTFAESEEFPNKKYNSETVLTYKNYTYTGFLKDGRRVGYGDVIDFERPEFFYTGAIAGDDPHGLGTIRYKDGGSFKGMCLWGDYYYGERKLANGKTYIGPYKDGKANGVGKYIFEDGSQYIGEFRDDQLEGYGIFIDKNGVRSMGKFSNNQFVE